MNNRTLFVFNTCGIGMTDKQNLNSYINNIKSIFSQKAFDKRLDQIVVSSCLNHDSVVQSLKVEFPNVLINRIFDMVPVNVSFNKTVQDAIKKYGEFDNFVYIDSGVCLENDEIYTAMLDTIQSNDDICMVSTNTDDDNGLWGWFPEGVSQSILRMPIGKAHNLHVQLFTKDLLNAYNNRILPDIFGSFSTESILTFVAASIGKEWIFLRDIIAKHNSSMDGASSGFKINRGWQHSFCSDRPIYEIITDPKAYESGLGYEECKQILVHSQSEYNNNKHIEPQRLLNFIKTNFYTQPHNFKYSGITSQWIN